MRVFGSERRQWRWTGLFRGKYSLGGWVVVGMKKRERKKMAPRFLACKTRWIGGDIWKRTGFVLVEWGGRKIMNAFWLYWISRAIEKTEMEMSRMILTAGQRTALDWRVKLARHWLMEGNEWPMSMLSGTWTWNFKLEGNPQRGRWKRICKVKRNGWLPRGQVKWRLEGDLGI